MVDSTCLGHLCSFLGFLCDYEDAWRMILASQTLKTQPSPLYITGCWDAARNWSHVLGLAAVSSLGIAKLPIQQIHREQGDITCESYSDSRHGCASHRQKGNKTPQTFPFHTAPEGGVKTEGGTCLQTSLILAESCQEGQG